MGNSACSSSSMLCISSRSENTDEKMTLGPVVMMILTWMLLSINLHSYSVSHSCDQQYPKSGKYLVQAQCDAVLHNDAGAL